MSAAGGGVLLSDVAESVAAGRPDEAAGSALRALKGGVPPLDVIRAAALAAASHYDVASGAPPRGLALLASAARMASVSERTSAVPILQVVAYLASEPRAPVPSASPLIVSGEVTHLGRSFLFAVRGGDLPDAEPIFLGMIDEGWERTMAGDILFRAALEDMGEGGRKLFISVRSWELARTLGFRDARTVLRPAVQYLVRGPHDRAAYEAIMSRLGKEWVDLEGLAAGGRPLDDAGRTTLASVLAADSVEACAGGTLALLRDGYAATGVASGLVSEAARRVLASPGFDLESARGVLFAHAARFVLTFSRTNERLYALFQAALRVRSRVTEVSLPTVPAGRTEAERVRGLERALDGRKPLDAASRVRVYLVRGGSTERLFDVLRDRACRDACAANQGINLFLADVCAAEFATSKDPLLPMALAKTIAASPKDSKAYESWRAALGL